MKTTITRFEPRHLVAAIALALGSGAAGAATITVDSSDDNAASTSCNLRSAIASINAGAAGAACAAATTGTFGDNDTIQFDGALAASTITLTQGQFAPTKPMTIQGSGQTIDAAGASSVMYALYAGLVLNDLTIRNGYSASVAGGISVVGGTVTLNRVDMSGNTVSGGALGAFGGQVASIQVNSSYLHGNTGASGGAVHVQNGELHLADTLIAATTATSSGGAVAIAGGPMTATDCQFVGNSAANGGAISTAAYVLLERTTFSGNSATQSGGAGYFSGSSGTLAFVDSTLSGNSAANGGAIGMTHGGSIDVTNSTLSGNTATGSGGAIYGRKYPQVTLTNATISGNSAASGGGMWIAADGNYGTTTLASSNSIVSANSAGNGKDMAGSYAQLTGNNNLFGTALNVAPFNNAGNANVFSDNPGLGPLADNGGTTNTRALLAGSPAIDAGSNAVAAGLTTDQRGTGFARVVGGTVDIGAYEYLGEDRIFLGDFEPGG